jgi:hypothetical protein
VNLATVANPAGTIVRFTFDERVASLGAASSFNVYNFNAPNTPIPADSVTLDAADATGRSVLARFNTLVSTAVNATARRPTSASPPSWAGTPPRSRTLRV